MIAIIAAVAAFVVVLLATNGFGAWGGEEDPAEPPEEIQVDIPEDIPEDLPDDVDEDIPEDVPEDIPEDIPDDTPKDVYERILAGETRNLPFGAYEWRVLAVEGGKALLYAEDCIGKLAYHEEYESVTWETCTLRGYMNGAFLQSFTAEEQGRILETRIANDDSLWHGTPGGNDTDDRIFLLSVEEIDRYFGDSGDYLNNRRKNYFGDEISDSDLGDGQFITNTYNNERALEKKNPNTTPESEIYLIYWLRSPGNLKENVVVVYGEDGRVNVGGYTAFNPRGGVRPALWLDLN